MPYEVRQLLAGLEQPVTATPEEPLQDALERMLKHNYSQLPVVHGTHYSLITSDSITATLRAFRVPITDRALRVSHALVKVTRPYSANDDLFELMRAIRDIGAALIVNDDNQLTHIVTSYDTTQYFRQWAEDIMLARDIEHSLKSFVSSAFRRADGTLDEEARQDAIADLTPSNKDLRKKFDRALGRYLKKQVTEAINLNHQWAGEAMIVLLRGAVNDGPKQVAQPALTEALEVIKRAMPLPSYPARDDPDGPPQMEDGEVLVDKSQELLLRFENALSYYLQRQAQADATLQQPWVDEAFNDLVPGREKIKTFSELSLDEYIKLFFHDKCWSRCCHVFELDKQAVDGLLVEVRDTRNRLAHFREDEITELHRRQLQICADWLGGLKRSVEAALEETAPLQ